MSSMNGVQNEAGRLYCDPRFVEVYLGDGTTRFSEHNLDTWLTSWHLFSQAAAGSVKWAAAKADIDLAIAGLDECVQEFFELYCVIGYTMEECGLIMEVPLARVRWYWWRLRSGVRGRVCDGRVRKVEPTGRGSIPQSFAGTCEGRWFDPDPATRNR